MALQTYEVQINGGTHYLRLTEDVVEQYPGAKLVESADDAGDAEVKHKARRPRGQATGSR